MIVAGHRMILLAVVLVSAGALAGCVSDESTSNTTYENEKTQTQSTSSNANTQVSVGQGDEAVDVHEVHDFSEDARTVTFDVAPNTTVSLQEIYIQGEPGDVGTPVTVAACSAIEPLEIKVHSPGGELVHYVDVPGSSFVLNGDRCGDEIVEEHAPGIAIEPGTWTIEFLGMGVGTGHVVIQS